MKLFTQGTQGEWTNVVLRHPSLRRLPWLFWGVVMVWGCWCVTHSQQQIDDDADLADLTCLYACVRLFFGEDLGT